MDYVVTSRAVAIMFANGDTCHYSRAMRLFNLGIKGGTTRKHVDWLVANGTFA